MAERTHIPVSPSCGKWETLLAEALDGVLRPEDESFFASHKEDCPYCTALYEDARRGREWLDFLALEPEIPADLLDKILATTGPEQAAGFGILPAQLQPAAVTGAGMIQPWQMTGRRSLGRGLMGTLRHFTEPRILMTAAMAFFSIALTLNLTGVKLQDMRLANLRPSAVRSFMERQVAVVSTPIVRYYDHLRLVYEVQTQMKELRQSTQGNQQQTAPGGNAPESQQTPGKKDGGSRLDLGVDPPEQSVTPADNDELQTWFDLQEGRGRAAKPGSVSSGMAGEGSAEWIA